VLKNLRKDTRGAVLAEFVIAIVPILTAFFSFVQLSHLATARLALKHGTIMAARGAAVITNAHDNTPGQQKGENNGDVVQGVQAAMYPWMANGNVSDVSVKITDESSKDDPYGWVTVEVSTTYHCTVPMGWIACGGTTRTLTETKRMPHQGANYK
jgi:Flp pilus assembly protein TadG